MSHLDQRCCWLQLALRFWVQVPVPTKGFSWVLKVCRYRMRYRRDIQDITCDIDATSHKQHGVLHVSTRYHMGYRMRYRVDRWVQVYLSVTYRVDIESISHAISQRCRSDITVCRFAIPHAISTRYRTTRVTYRMRYRVDIK